MSDERGRAGEDGVSLAVRQIRAYHRLGRQFLKELPERGGYGEGFVAAQAERLTDGGDDELVRLLGGRWNETKVRKARQFADEAEGYSQDRLNELCRLLREHRPVFGVSHVGLLVTVPWPAREQLQRECVEGNWSTHELQSEIKRRYGSRRHGGRRRRVSADPAQALVQLDGMADAWLRWFEIAGEAGDEGETVLDALPGSVRDRARAVRRAVSRLREAITEELEAGRREAEA